jgi:hypothetical protein
MHTELQTETPNPSSTTDRNRAGVVGMVLSIVGFCLCGLWLLTIPGLILSLIGLRKEPRTAAIAGSIVGAIGVLEFFVMGPLVLGIFLPAFFRARENALENVTINQIQSIREACDVYKSDNRQFPTSLDALIEGNYIIEDATTDHWDNRIRFEISGDGAPVITSAGRDGIFDTKDDLPASGED